MNRSIFGWSLPPGVTDRMIDEAAGGDEGERPLPGEEPEEDEDEDEPQYDQDLDDDDED